MEYRKLGVVCSPFHRHRQFSCGIHDPLRELENIATQGVRLDISYHMKNHAIYNDGDDANKTKKTKNEPDEES